jgi:hypothetical protein
MSEERRLAVGGVVAASVGENQTDAAPHGSKGGAHGVAAGRDIVHEVNQPLRQTPEGGF